MAVAGRRRFPAVWDGARRPGSCVGGRDLAPESLRGVRSYDVAVLGRNAGAEWRWRRAAHVLRCRDAVDLVRGGQQYDRPGDCPAPAAAPTDAINSRCTSTASPS